MHPTDQPADTDAHFRQLLYTTSNIDERINLFCTALDLQPNPHINYQLINDMLTTHIDIQRMIHMAYHAQIGPDELHYMLKQIAHHQTQLLGCIKQYLNTIHSLPINTLLMHMANEHTRNSIGLLAYLTAGVPRDTVGDESVQVWTRRPRLTKLSRVNHLTSPAECEHTSSAAQSDDNETTDSTQSSD